MYWNLVIKYFYLQCRVQIMWFLFLGSQSCKRWKNLCNLCVDITAEQFCSWILCAGSLVCWRDLVKTWCQYVEQFVLTKYIIGFHVVRRSNSEMSPSIVTLLGCKLKITGVVTGVKVDIRAWRDSHPPRQNSQCYFILMRIRNRQRWVFSLSARLFGSRP